MSKWILALCLGLSGTVGCGMGPEEEEATSASDTTGAATSDVESVQSEVRYIDYGALNGNKAPCPSNLVLDTRTKRCVPRPASIYHRGCTAATRCARG